MTTCVHCGALTFDRICARCTLIQIRKELTATAFRLTRGNSVTREQGQDHPPAEPNSQQSATVAGLPPRPPDSAADHREDPAEPTPSAESQNQACRWSSSGEVISDPVVSANHGLVRRLLGALTLPLALLALLTNRTFILLALVCFVVWILLKRSARRPSRQPGRSGLLDLILLMRRPRQLSTPAVTSVLTFRINTATRELDCQFNGHASDVHIGDRVDVNGLLSNGMIRAVRIYNRTTQATFVRRQMVSTAILFAIDVTLVMVVVSQLTGQ